MILMTRFLLARLAYPHLDSFSLDTLLAFNTGKDIYSEHGISKSEFQKSNWKSPVLTPKQLLYASIDVYYLLDLYDAIKHFKDTTSYKLDMLSLRYAMDFQRNGIPVDRERLLETLTQNLKDIENLQLPINPNSYQQVRPYIGSSQSDGLGLAKLELSGNEKAANVRKARSWLKQNSFLSKYDTDDGRVYGHFSPGARSW